MHEPKELFEFLLEQYQSSDYGGVGIPTTLSALDELDNELKSTEERMAARAGIKHFLEFCRQHMLEHPPQTHIMLHEGFGVQLAGGQNVSLTPSVVEGDSDGVEPTPSFPVTEGRSVRGQGGVQHTDSINVTGREQSAYAHGRAKR